MQQYWARHEGKWRWGVRAPIETSEALYKSDTGVFFVWADRVEVRDGNLIFLKSDGQIQAAIAAGRWEAVFEAGQDDSPRSVETRA